MRQCLSYHQENRKDSWELSYDKSTKLTFTIPVVLVIVVGEEIDHRVVTLVVALTTATRLRLFIDVAVVFTEIKKRILWQLPYARLFGHRIENKFWNFCPQFAVKFKSQQKIGFLWWCINMPLPPMSVQLSLKISGDLYQPLISKQYLNSCKLWWTENSISVWFTLSPRKNWTSDIFAIHIYSSIYGTFQSIPFINARHISTFRAFCLTYESSTHSPSLSLSLSLWYARTSWNGTVNS